MLSIGLAISPFKFLRDSFNSGSGDPDDFNFPENYCSSKNLELSMFAKTVIRSHVMQLYLNLDVLVLFREIIAFTNW